MIAQQKNIDIETINRFYLQYKTDNVMRVMLQAMTIYRYYSNLIQQIYYPPIMLSLSKQTRQYTYQIPQCHNKLNQYGKLALQTKPQLFRSLYSSKLNNSNASTKKSNKDGQETLSMMLLSKRSRSQMKEINPELQQSLMKLEMLGLTTPRELRQVKYEGSIKIPTVHNDYHTRATNHGFSRSQTGGIFPK